MTARVLRPLSLSLIALAAAGALVGPALAKDKPAAKPAAWDQAAVERAFDAQIDPAEMTGWLQALSSAPNHVGSPHDKANAEYMLAKFKSWGWDAHIEEFQVLYPTPVTETLELVGPEPYKATLTEAPVAGDRTSGAPGQLPAYLAFQGDGDVTGELVYVNYGMPDDYKALERKGVDVRGKIVITRYGGGWRGLKPLLAQQHGAIGCIIYSDPKEDGYYGDDTYPKSGQRPPQGIQRGSVQDMTLNPGDPLTPGIGATKDAKRLTREEARTILKIPAIPISYGEAQHFLAALGGPVAPPEFRGALPLTYHVGPGPARVHLVVKSEWSLKTIYDTVAMIKGSEYPDQWVMRGNHHDGWVFGASDPLSGNTAMLGEAKAIGGLLKQGWRPKRTLVYLGWDAEEPGLIGSTEWVETHAVELQKKGVVYINTDNIGRGYWGAEGSHSWQHLANTAAADVTDPETGVTVRERTRAKALVDGAANGASERAREAAKVAAKGGDLPIGPLGSGSDYSAFLQHLGIGALDIRFGGEDESGGVYHSAYDSFDHYTRFDDPGLAYVAALSKTAGRVALRAADAEIIPQRFTDFADTVAGYDRELKKLLSDTREKTEAQARLTKADAWRLSSDPLKPDLAPAPESAVPALDFAALDGAVSRLGASARAYDAALDSHGAGLNPAQRAKLNGVLQGIEQTLLSDEGLPRRPWFRNMVYAPGVLTGYGAKTLPAIREAIESRRWEEAQAYMAPTAKTLDAYGARLDQATAILNGK